MSNEIQDFEMRVRRETNVQAYAQASTEKSVFVRAAARLNLLEDPVEMAHRIAAAPRNVTIG